MISRFLKAGIVVCAFTLSCLVFSGQEIATDIFDSLTKIREYANIVPEYPKPDNSDWENPDFSSFHSKVLPKILKASGKLKSLWKATEFKNLLDYVLHVRERNGYQGKFVMKLYPVPGTQVIVFGELHGAFHSLARDLDELKKLEYIDEHLKIIKLDCNIVFNGNISSRSPYILETMTVVLRLMAVNPDKIIWIRGSQEDKERWIHYGLKNELRTRVSQVVEGKDTLGAQINRFFNTLPLALYLIGNTTEKNIEIVRISNYDTDTKELSEKEFADFFAHRESITGVIEEGSRKKSSIDISLRGIIRGEQFYRSQYIPSTGLQLAGREEGATSWVIMSSPTEAYQKLFQFFYDAFTILTTHKSLDEWTFALINRDVRESESFRQTKVFKLIAGLEMTAEQVLQSQLKSYEEKIAYLENTLISLDETLKTGRFVQLKQKLISLETAPKPEEKETSRGAKRLTIVEQASEGIPWGSDSKCITIGTLVDLSANTKEEGESIVLGIRAVFDKINQKGGIGGKKLKLEVQDTRYSREYARRGMDKLLSQYNVGIVLDPLSTGPLEGILELVKEKKVLALFPLASGATNIRKREISNLFFLRASTVQEGYIITKYVIENMKARKVALFYENDTFGIDTLRGAQQALNELDAAKDALFISYEPYDLNIVEQVSTLKKSNVDALGCFGMQAVVKELYTQLGTEWLVNKKLFGSMDLSMLSFRKYCERNRLQFVSTSVVPDPEKSNIEIVQEYRKSVENTPPSNDIHCLEAYIGADFFVHVLEQVGEPITSEKIIHYLENIKNYRYKGLELTFNPSTRQLMHKLWLNRGSSEWDEISTLSYETGVEEAKEIKEEPGVKTEVGKEERTNVTRVKKVNGKEFVIGSSMDFSRGAKDICLAVKGGIDLAFDAEPIAGLKKRFIVLDDSYLPSQSRANVLKLIEQYGADILFCPIGSPTFAAYIDLIKGGKVAVLFPIPGISSKRTDENRMKYCVYYRPSYFDEGFVLMRYIKETKNPQEVALFYQDDEFGLACVQGVHEAIGNDPIKIIELPYARNDVNFDAQVRTIKNSKIKYIALFSTTLSSRQFLEQLGDETIRKSIFFGVSDLGGLAFKKMARKKGINIIISHIVPDIETSSIPLIEEYRNRAKKAGIAVDSFSLEGYITASIIVEVLKRVQTSAITKDSIIEEIEKLKDYNLKGLPLNFDDKTRKLSKTIWIEDGKGQWIEYSLTDMH